MNDLQAITGFLKEALHHARQTNNRLQYSVFVYDPKRKEGTLIGDLTAEQAAKLGQAAHLLNETK